MSGCFFSEHSVVLRCKFHHEMGASINGGVGKTSHFLPLNVNISKTAGDTSKVTIND